MSVRMLKAQSCQARTPTQLNKAAHQHKPDLSTLGRQGSVSTLGRQGSGSTLGRQGSVSTLGRQGSVSTLGRQGSVKQHTPLKVSNR